jgi:gliding motility-associated-like protein
MNSTYMKKSAAAALALSCFWTASAQLKINEYSASNISTVNDGFGNSSDWVELFNTGASPVTINGYFLSDDKTSTAKWQIPATPVVTIPAGGRILLFCSSQDTILPSGQIHTGFKLTQCHNEQVVLSDAAAVIVDSTTMLRTQANHSWARVPDGSATWKLMTTPSPNAVNAGGFARYVIKPSLSIAPGFYAAAQTVSLACADPNTTIRYTLNGSAPTLTSPIYSTPLNVAATTVVRALATSTDPTLSTSFTETNTYFINDQHKFATLSLSGNFTNGSGLFQSGQDVRQCVEFFDSTDNFKWETDGTAYRHGHDSWAYAQKGFRISAEDEYGYLAELPEKFFDNSSKDSFDVVIIKAAASDNYDGNQRGAHMRDAYAHTFSIKYNLNFDERSYQPCVIFINGQYWGVYEIRERVDLDYVKDYYDQPEKKVDMVRFWGGTIIDAGSDAGWISLRNFINNNNMALPANLAIVDSQLDFMSIIDFFIYNNYIANSDHMNWNTHWWRGGKNPRVKWRYALWDMDNIFDLGQNFTGLSTTGADLDPCEPFTLFTNSNTIFHTQIINGLMTNPQFRKLYQDRYVELLSTSLTCDTLLKHLNYFETLLQDEMPAQIARWGGSMQGWRNNVDTIRQFIMSRCQLVAGDLDTCMNIKRITLNVDALGMGTIKLGVTTIPNYPNKRVVALDTLLELTAVPSPGFQFVEWRKYNAANVITPTINTANVFMDYKQEDSIVAVFTIKPKDSFNVVVSNNAPWAGTILVDGTTTVAGTPVVFKWEEATNHTLVANSVNINKHIFTNWTHANPGNNVLTPNKQSNAIDFAVKFSLDTLIANYDTVITLQRYLYLPNAFTPNGDGINEQFGNLSKFNPDMKAAQMMIVDRLGAVVFNGDVMNKGWDGLRDGQQEAGQAVYMYHLQITLTDGKKYNFQGDVELLR